MSSCNQNLRALFIAIPLLFIVLNLGIIGSLSIEASGQVQKLNMATASNDIDLKYLSEHLREYEGVRVTTNGTVRFYASIYMFEDFWLQAQNSDAKIPVVTRLAGLAVPPEMTEIEITGTIKYSTLEGGFYFLEASFWNALTTSPEETVEPTPPQTPAATSSPKQTPTECPTNQSPLTTASPALSPGSTGSPATVIPPEVFYIVAAIGLTSIAAIALLAFKKLKK